MRFESRRHRRAGAMIGGAILLAALGCASVATRAPVVTAAMTDAAAVRGADPAALERGRELYVGRCTRCHGPVAVASRTPQQWQAILPRMAKESRLDSSQIAEVAAYIEAVIGADAR